MALSAGMVGRRVVVRRVLPAEIGPSGGPAMTDVLGVLEEWTPDQLTVRRADGRLAVIDQADVVAAKPVPPPPTKRAARRPAGGAGSGTGPAPSRPEPLGAVDDHGC